MPGVLLKHKLFFFDITLAMMPLREQLGSLNDIIFDEYINAINEVNRLTFGLVTWEVLSEVSARVAAARCGGNDIV